VTKHFRNFFNTKKWPKIYFFLFEKFLRLKSDQNFFQKFSKKSTIFQIYHLTFSKNIFFEVTNFFENVFGENWGVYDRCLQVWDVLLYRCIPQIAILLTWGCFLALFAPSRGEKGQKKTKQTNSWQKKLPSKKKYEYWLRATLQKINHGCTIISHIRLLLGGLFVPTRYYIKKKEGLPWLSYAVKQKLSGKNFW